MAILVQKDAYLLELSRYVVLNPVRAGMVKDLQEWPWSSYGSMIGKSPAPAWLETDWILACFGKQRKRARAKYIDFVRAGIGLSPLWEGLKYQIYLGSDEFVKSMRHKLDGSKKEDLREISRLQRRCMAKPLQWYEENTSDRKKAMALNLQWYEENTSDRKKAMALNLQGQVAPYFQSIYTLKKNNDCKLL